MRLPSAKSAIPIALVIALVVGIIYLNTNFNLLGQVIDPNTTLGNTVSLIINIVSLVLGTGIITFLIRAQASRRVFQGVTLKIVSPAESESILADLFEELSGHSENGYLAEHLIPYQLDRVGHENAREEILDRYRQSRYVLILGPTGIGKTREAGEVAKALCQEGWYVLIYRGGWLDRPPSWPPEWPRRPVLLIVDNIHAHCGNSEQHPSTKELGGFFVPEIAFQRRFQRLIGYLEKELNEDRVRILATSRSEKRYFNSLKTDKFHDLWNAFEVYELSQPTETALVSLLEACAAKLQIPLNSNDHKQYIGMTDRMPLTIVAKLRSAGRRRIHLEPEHMVGTSDKEWSEWYQFLVKDPNYRYLPEIYDAVNKLLEMDIPLDIDIIIISVNEHLKGYPWTKFIRTRKIKMTVYNLLNERNGWWKRKEDGAIWVRPEILTGKPDLASFMHHDVY